MINKVKTVFGGQLKKVPRGVWALGFVSMLMDTSSEMVLSLLPVYLVTVLGASTLSVGIIEGIAEATASLSKIFSGVISDAIGKRKILTVIGYGLSAVTKPIFPLARSIEWIIAARFIDRVGKGIRGAPRDALMGDLTPPEVRGASFGLRQSLDTFGAFLGPLLAIGLMIFTADNYKFVFWVAAIPAFAAVALLVFMVEEPQKKENSKAGNNKFEWKKLGSLELMFWIVVVMASVGTLARFSEAFLILRAQSVGLGAAWMPMVFVVMNLVYAFIATPVGILSDKLGRKGLLALGYFVLLLADAVLAFASTIATVFVGIVLWGVHMGMSQGLFSAMVADTAKSEQRGTAFGIYNFATGISLLIASVIAGWLWDIAGPKATFAAGGIFASVTFAGIILLGARQSLKNAK